MRLVKPVLLQQSDVSCRNVVLFEILNGNEGDSMTLRLCFFWSNIFPAAVIDFFYYRIFLFVLGAWLVFAFACFFHRRFAFSKPILIFFILCIGIFSFNVIWNGFDYVEILFNKGQHLIEYYNSGEFSPFGSSPYYPVDGSFYSTIEYQMGNRLTDTTYYRLASSIPVGFACFVYYLLFLFSLLRKGLGRTRKGGISS